MSRARTHRTPQCLPGLNRAIRKDSDLAGIVSRMHYHEATRDRCFRMMPSLTPLANPETP